MKSIFKATAIVLIFSIITRGISFIYRIYLSRIIGAEGMGLYQIVLSLFSVFITVTSSGIPVTVSKQTAAHITRRNERAEFSTVTAALIVGLIFSCAISLFIYVFKDQLAFIFADPRCMPIFVLLLPAIITSSMYSAFRGGLWGKRNYVSYSLAELAEEIVMVISGILLMQGIITIGGGAASAVMSITISYFGGCFVTILLYFLKGGKLASPRGYFKPLLKSALPITGIRIITTILQTIIAFILPTLLAKYSSPSEAIASFGTMMGMTFPLLFLPSTIIGSLALVLVPEISTMRADGNTHGLAAGMEKAFNFSMYITFLIIPLYIAMGTEICAIVYNNTVAGTYLKFAAILMVPLGMSQMCSTMLNSLGMEIKTFKNSLIGSGLLLLCCTVLPRFVGIYAMIIGHLLSLSVSFALNMIAIKKVVPLPMQFLKQSAYYLAFSIPTIVFGYSACGLLSRFLPSIIAVTISGVAMTVMFVALTVIFKIVDITLFKSFIKPKRKKLHSVL